MNKNFGTIRNVLLAALVCTGAFMAQAQTTECADGMGILVTGRDNTTRYCLSKISMNWYSAFAWCDSIGGQLFNVNTECLKTTATSDECPQIRGFSSIEAWTVNTIDEDTAVLAVGWSGVGTSRILNLKKINRSKALCTMPSL